jgi:hypothetical protein
MVGAASSLRGANGSRERAPYDRLRDDDPSRRRKKQWIVSSQVLLAMTATEVRGVDYEA